MSDSLQPPWTVAHRLHGIFQARSTGVGCHPPGDHQDPGSNRHLLNLLRWQVDSSPLAPPSQKQPFILCLIILVSLPGTLFYLFIYFAIPCGMWDLSSAAAATAAKSLQLCPTLRDPIDGSPPGSPVPGILQPRTLEWVAISFSNAWKWKVKVKSLSCVRLLATPWTAAHQAPPSMGFSRQEYWSGVPLPSSNTPTLNN